MKKIGLMIFLLIFTIIVAACTSQVTDVKEEKNSKAAKINVRLGAAYLERKDIVRAKQKFLTALKLAPHLPEAWYSMAYFFETTGNNELAKEYFLQSVLLAPARGDVQNNYATYLCRTGKYKASIEHFLLAVHDREYLDSASAYENAGICARKIPDLKLAAEYFDKALQQDPARATSLIELAELHYQLGNSKLAKYELDQFLKVSAPTVQSYVLGEKIDHANNRNNGMG